MPVLWMMHGSRLHPYPIAGFGTVSFNYDGLVMQDDWLVPCIISGDAWILALCERQRRNCDQQKLQATFSRAVSPSQPKPLSPKHAEGLKPYTSRPGVQLARGAA